MRNIVKEYVESCGGFKKISNTEIRNLVDEIKTWKFQQIFVGSVNVPYQNIGISHSNMLLDKNYYKDSFFHCEGIGVMITDNYFDQKKYHYTLYTPLIWIKNIKQNEA